MSAPTTSAKRKLLLGSAIDSSFRLVPLRLYDYLDDGVAAVIEPAGGSAAALGRGALPIGFRPQFILLACLISLCCFGIVGSAAGYGGVMIDNNINSNTTEPLVMCIGQLCLHPGFYSLSTVVQEQLIQVIGSAVAAGSQGSALDCTSATASGYGGVATTTEP
ncbi:hypothetical protein CYMTET_27099 [Cymbomonas tetramitiformis]|uniref:Uncharacterized protein n=1 Tax=Cymbomonas tetramitiformis TaxID=36881 RepID=A0AAE0KXI0_9CHLO|nr:hypothetical protein CYMTET_27099 [Cymbomonas tetramitiformis]